MKISKFVYILLYPLIQILTLLLGWIGIVFAIFTLGHLNSINNYFNNIDITKDKCDNVVMQYLFNLIFIKSPGYKFGNPNATISDVLYSNYKTNTLTWLGRKLSNFLIKQQDPSFKN